MPSRPPLNGRSVAEFYVASEVAKRSVLRAYAKPRNDQEARILIYDPIRRIIAEYFRSDRADAVLNRVQEQLKRGRFNSSSFTETWHKANSTALAALRQIEIRGSFEEVRTMRASTEAANLRVISTADFYAKFVPKLGKPRTVAVIVNPSLNVRPDKRRTWVNIESEIALRAAADNGIGVADVLYVDLRKHEIVRCAGPKIRIWDEIVATCERLMRDWRDLRREEPPGEERGTA